MYHQVLILGAGASGLMASLLLKDFGIDVALIEGGDRVGKKLLSTGNGRCNISNKNILKERYHSSNPEFFNAALARFTPEDTVGFFYSLGLPIITLEEGKMYPRSLQASSVLDLFRLSLEEKSIPLYTNCKVNKVEKSKGGFTLYAGDESFSCKTLLLSTGGKAAPATGSDGSGYSLIRALGHSIISPIPSLVQLKLDYPNIKALSGIKFDGIVSAICDHEVIRKEMGEILFTDYGISGPPVLQLSGEISKCLHRNKAPYIEVDMFYDKSVDTLKEFLEGHFSLFGHRSVIDSLIGIINKKLIPTLLKEAGITNLHKPCGDLSWREKERLYSLLKAWSFKVADTNSFSNAQVTAGGVDTREVNEETLESLIVPNLYFAGEVLDVDGDCGGFNLQWCWSSAYAAAKAIACK